MLQTNNTGVCSQCLGYIGPAPAHGAHSSGSGLLHWELSEASHGLHAPPRSKPLRLRDSGSPQRRRLGWAGILCLSQVRVAQVFGERSRCDLSPLCYLLLSLLSVQPATDGDRPEPQEVLKKLAKKPVCSLVVNVSLGLLLPPSGPSGSGCLTLEGDCLQPARSVQFFVL